MGESIEHQVGRHAGEIEALQNDMQELRRDVKTILLTLSEARGGWKTLMLVAGIAGAVGAFLHQILLWTGWVAK